MISMQVEADEGALAFSKLRSIVLCFSVHLASSA